MVFVWVLETRFRAVRVCFSSRSLGSRGSGTMFVVLLLLQLLLFSQTLTLSFIIVILPRTYFSWRVGGRVRRHGGRRTAVLVLSGWRRSGRVGELLLLVHRCRRRRRRRRGPRYVDCGGGGGGGGAARILCCCRGGGGGSGSGRRVGHVTRGTVRTITAARGTGVPANVYCSDVRRKTKNEGGGGGKKSVTGTGNDTA